MSASEIRPVNLTISGDGADSGRWARAFRAIEGVSVERIAGDDDAALADLSQPGRDAVVLVAPHSDLAGAIRRATLAGRHVFVAGPDGLGSKQLLALGDLARRRNRAIVFDGGALGDEQLAFVRKMTTGANALWRPRYLRALRTGERGLTLDALAVTQLARVLAVAGGVPAMVSAVTPRIDDESGTADVAFITLWFDGGPVARVDVSLLEPQLRDEMVVGCDARTIVLQPLDREAPLLIRAAANHRGPKRGGDWAETVTEHPVGEPRERIQCAAEIFVAALRAGDASATNAEEAARAALTWERARASIGRDGEPVRIDDPCAAAQRPAFELIHGGGHATGERSAARLTVVARH
jgi:predicted dehydrogenase